ncbi:MAG: SRPBCC family protein, partial [Planctomycetota bacterium]
RAPWALAGPGAFRSLDLGAVPIAVVRDDNGDVHGFVNACVHRGACVLREAAGRVERIVCPYHGFTYDRAGRLTSAAERSTFGDDLEGAGMRSIGVEERFGWVWARVDGSGPSLASELGPELLDELENWPLADWTAVTARDVDCAFDWKIGVEAFLEPLHVATIHARSAHPMVHARRAAMRRLGPHSRMALPFRVPGAFEPDGLLGAAAAAAGVVPPSSLLPVQRRAHLVYFVHPATVLMLFPTHALSLRFLPSAPGRCTLRYELLAPAATDDASERWRASLIPGYDALLEEDLENLPWIERGLFSGRVDAHPLSALEVRVAWFRDALREDREAALLARNEHAPGLGDDGDAHGPAAERQDLVG